MEVQNSVAQFLLIIEKYKKERNKQAIESYIKYDELFKEPYFQAFLKKSPLVVALYDYPTQRFVFISESVSDITCLTQEDFTNENGTETFMRAIDGRGRKAMLEIIVPSMMKVCASYPERIKDLSFTTCLQVHLTEKTKKWVLMNLYMLEATSDGFPLISCTLVQDVDQIKKDDLIYFSEKILDENHNEVVLKHGIISDNNDELNLSKRELEVLRYICKGYTTNEIADKLFLSVDTVKKHRTNILSKSNCANTPELVTKATLMGVL